MKHSGLLLLTIGFFTKIASLFTTTNIAYTLQVLSIFAVSMSIIYYSTMFIKWVTKFITETKEIEEEVKKERIKNILPSTTFANTQRPMRLNTKHNGKKRS